MHEFDRLTELQLDSPQSGTSLLEKLLGSLWQELPDRGGCPSTLGLLHVFVFFTSEREDCSPLGLSRYAQADCVDSLR